MRGIGQTAHLAAQGQARGHILSRAARARGSENDGGSFLQSVVTHHRVCVLETSRTVHTCGNRTRSTPLTRTVRTCGNRTRASLL